MSRLRVFGLGLLGSSVTISLVASLAWALSNKTLKESELLTLNMDRLNKRHYYLMDIDYTCNPYAVEGRSVKSYREHIQFLEGKVIFHGDGCHENVRSISFEANDFRFSPDTRMMRYKGQWYEHHARPPEFRNANTN